MSNPARIVRFSDPSAAVAAVRAAGLRVVTFLGFSGSGYDDAASVEKLVEQHLSRLDPATTIVCSGATEEGIGAVYRLAKARGFATIGIVSSVALDDGARFSDDADTICVIEDDSWGGRRNDGSLSPTSTAMVHSADEMIAIGGGEIARDEIEAARGLGKPVRYEAADMGHAAARDAAQRKGQPEPTDFKGPVHRLFEGG
jgi:hypothetical protein